MSDGKRKIVYVTKSINGDMSSHYDPEFKYPKKGWVEAKDWQNSKECGGGLHGFLWGEGDGGLASFSDKSIWILIKVRVSDGLIVMDDKCKFRRGYVVTTGDYKTIADKLQKLLPKDKIYKVIAGTATAGDEGTATAGYMGTATAGYMGTATAGNEGTATAGYMGTATAGNRGTATAGNEGTATAGDEGVISIVYYDEIKGKWRKKIGQIGENGLEPNIQYKLDSTHNFIKVE